MGYRSRVPLDRNAGVVSVVFFSVCSVERKSVFGGAS